MNIYQTEQKGKRSFLEAITDFSFFMLVITTILSVWETLRLISSALLFGLVLLKIMKNRKIYFDQFLGFYYLFIVYNLLNSVQSVNQSVSINIIYSNLLLNFISMVFVYNYILHKNDNIQVLKIFAMAVVFSSIIIFVSSFGNISEMRLGTATLFDRDPNILSKMFAFAFLIYFYFILAKIERKRAMLAVIWLFSLITLTGSRQGILYIALGVTILVQTLYAKKFLRNMILISLIMIAGYLILTQITVFYDIAGYRVENLLNFMSTDGVSEASINTRNRYMNFGWSYIKEKPILGYGLGSFHYIQGSAVHAHSNVVDILFCCGIVGFLIFYTGMVITTVRAFRSGVKYNSLGFLLFSLTFVNLLLSYVGIVYFSFTALLIIIIMAALSKNIIKTGNERCAYEKNKKHNSAYLFYSVQDYIQN